MAVLDLPGKDMKTVVIYRPVLQERDLLGEWFASRGWNVAKISGAQKTEMPECADLLVIEADLSYEGADGPVGSGHDYDAISRRVSESIQEVCGAVESCLPALERGNGKRIGILSHKMGSIRSCTDTDHFAAHMILAGIHMEAMLLYNQLHKKGYTMRLFAEEETEKQGISAGDYLTMDFSFDPEDAYIHSEENRFVFRDSAFTELPW